MSPRLRRIALVLSLALSALAAVALLAFGGFVIWLRNADLAPIAAREASEALGREVSIGELRIRWDDPLGLEVTDLRVANAAWGSRPDMIRIGRFAALLDLGALWRGELRYERLRILDATIALERDKQGVGNWKFPGMESGGDGDGGFALVPRNRTQFPTLIDFAGWDGLITYRTRSGNILRIALDEVAIASPAEDTPVRVTATGAYNGVAARVTATTDSFASLREAEVPFAMPFTLTGEETEIAFDGTAMEPLDFEGVRGALALKADSLNEILAALGGPEFDLPLTARGKLRRDGDRWSMTAAKGKLAKTDFAGNLGLVEGKAGQPDDIALDLDLAPLDLDPILAAAGLEPEAGKRGGWQDLPLYPAALNGLKLTADLATPQLSFGATTLRDFALQGRAADGKVTLKTLRFAFGGGSLALAGDLESTGKGAGALSLQARLAKADIARIARLLGGQGDEIRGRLDGAATLSLQGATFGEAFARARGAALLTLGNGDVARSLIEQVSADLRSIFREKPGRVRVACLLAAMSVKQGIGTLAPLRLETDAATLRGVGTVDLGAQQLDLTLQTERDSTNFFALDLPIRINGPFADLAVNPQIGEESGLPEGGQARALGKLPASLRALAEDNACVG